MCGTILLMLYELGASIDRAMRAGPKGQVGLCPSEKKLSNALRRRPVAGAGARIVFCMI